MEGLIQRGEAISRNFMIFLAGFLSCIILLFIGSLGAFSAGVENPLSMNVFNLQQDALSPGDWISQNQIFMNKDSIVIMVPNASLSSYAPTGSMEPVFDENSNGIRIKPADEDQIQVGDIITYGDKNIVHRVIEKGEDEGGVWFMAKGDNNDVDDGVKIRFSDIKYVTIGVLY